MPDSLPGPVYELSEHTLIGRGSKRECHAHPGHDGLCIKVANDSARWVECQVQSVVESHYFAALSRRGVALRHMAACHGWVATTHGAGLVTERIRDDRGQPARTLREAVATGELDLTQAYMLLEALKQWALAHAVVIGDLRSTNLMVRWCDGQPSLVFVDGIGNRKLNWKFTLYLRYLWLARLKTRRQWRRQWARTDQALRECASQGRTNFD